MAIVLKTKEEIANIQDGVEEARATLYWQTRVDLDLWVMYQLKGGTVNVKPPKKKGFLGSVVDAFTNSSPQPMNISARPGEVGFNNKGHLRQPPFIRLDEDQGIGGKLDQGTFNEENVNFTQLSTLDAAIICANIYGKQTNFAQYGGNVTVRLGGQEIVVPLTETETGAWCVVALIDNRNPMGATLKNVNHVLRNRPKLTDYL